MTHRDLPTAVNFGPRIEVPGTAPALKVDVNNPHLSLEDVLPENFFSMESLQAWLTGRRAEARVLTVTGVSLELLYDPSKGEKPEQGNWRPCLCFAETDTLLVINKTRAGQLTALAGSPLLAHWAEVGQVALTVGVFNGKAQIGIEAIPDGESGSKSRKGKGKKSVGDINEDLGLT